MAYVVLGCLNIFIGIVSTVSTFILESFPEEEELTLISGQLKKVSVCKNHLCRRSMQVIVCILYVHQDKLDELASKHLGT